MTTPLSVDKRVCPACHARAVDVASLHRGVPCHNCGRVIEIDFFYSAGIPVVLAILITFFFNQGHGIAGFLCLGLLLTFTAAYQSLFVRWLPLKHYPDKP